MDDPVHEGVPDGPVEALAAALPVLDPEHLAEAVRGPSTGRRGRSKPSRDITLVQEALTVAGFPAPVDGVPGDATRAAYRRLQRYLGYWGPDADGIPGRHSLTWLGLKSGLFTVGRSPGTP